MSRPVPERDYPLACERTGRGHAWAWDDDWNESYCPDCGVETCEDMT